MNQTLCPYQSCACIYACINLVLHDIIFSWWRLVPVRHTKSNRSWPQSPRNNFNSWPQGLEIRGGDRPTSAPYNAEVASNFCLAYWIGWEYNSLRHIGFGQDVMVDGGERAYLWWTRERATSTGMWGIRRGAVLYDPTSHQMLTN